MRTSTKGRNPLEQIISVLVAKGVQHTPSRNAYSPGPTLQLFFSVKNMTFHVTAQVPLHWTYFRHWCFPRPQTPPLLC